MHCEEAFIYRELTEEQLFSVVYFEKRGLGGAMNLVIKPISAIVYQLVKTDPPEVHFHGILSITYDYKTLYFTHQKYRDYE